ncbi:LOW QUALITY PROTEIN: predicted flavin reductase RutF in novel pyrimidine catabolism pathway [Psychrobacter sp. JCM 18900]|nr:LOW QUALITY PROTEIN: predicted flavin reductase RutF in novel pyrimidine catabolism pathway [Psychrobacter sp. JCM 18900]
MQQSFRDAMSKLAAAVNIITTEGPAGRAGFTASAVCSVTDEPPTLLVCLNRSASVYKFFRKYGAMRQHTWSTRLKRCVWAEKKALEERFEQGNWSTLSTGSPVLEDASISFDCKIKLISSVGTHDILICEVLDIKHKPDCESLIYFNRDYHQLSKCKN